MHPPEDLRADTQDGLHRRDFPRSAGARWPAAVLIVVIAAAAGFWWWYTQLRTPTAQPPVASAPAVPRPAASAASAPAYPLDMASESPLALADVEPALVELFGAQAVKSFLQIGDFPRRVVATIDNLARSHAPSAVWPVKPAPGRFTVEETAQGTTIAASNAQRYAPFIRWAGDIDAKKAVALYRRMYPLLDEAYRELGLGNRYLNDRVVEVVDALLATPEPKSPPLVQLEEVKGPYPSERPWVRYQYVDPALESLDAGQKILVRVGPANERILKRKLAEIRQLLVQARLKPAGGS
jgi:hypothetical protein